MNPLNLKPNIFIHHQLTEIHDFYTAQLPKNQLKKLDFETIWNLHPEEYHTIKIHGKEVKTPRWQMPYGRDYHFSGNTYQAVAVPDQLMPVHNWCKENIYENLNGLLLNWYDGERKHYIGKHRDSTSNMIPDAPIVTISLGEERVFRLRPYKGKEIIDFPAPHGTVFVLPYATNQAFTHEVPHFQRFKGRRLSVTLRGFKQ